MPMRRRSLLPLWIFCLAAAVTAAAVVDPIMERLSNTGIFGPGTLTDRSNLDIVPALGAAAALSLVVLIGLVRRTLAGASHVPGWLHISARAADDATLPRVLPAIYALQIATLFAMETVEQVIVAGHPLGGSIWLGGPPALSLLLHAVGCVAITVVLSRVLRWSAQTLLEIVAIVRELVLATLGAPAPATAASAWRTTIRRPLEEIIERLTGRAPPYLFA
ncbi:hypothetical protein EPN44_13245 [bacterium]|nr:MAG: hypothetical protein EPN44_13245 [bacterium]